MGKDLGKHESRKKMTKFDSFMRPRYSGEETGSEGRGEGASWEVSEAFATAAPGKGRIGEGESFPFSADHGKISILGITCEL